MKKMKVVRSRKRFNGEEGSEVRDSEGNLVRFGYESDEDYEARSNAKKAAEGRKKDVEFSGRTTPRDAVENAVDFTDAVSNPLNQPKRRPPAPAPLPAPKPAPESKPMADDAESEAEARREKMLKGDFEKSKSNDAESEAEARREKMLKGDFEKSKTETKPAKKKPETKSEEKFDSIGGGRGTFAGKTAEQEEESRKKFAESKNKNSAESKNKNPDEIPNVEKIKKEQEGMSEKTSLESSLSDTAGKILGATGAGVGAAALGKQAYKMAKAPLGFMGEAKRMASNAAQSLRNAVSGRKPNPAGEGAAAAKEATKFEGLTKAEKAREKAKDTIKSKSFAEEVKEGKRKRASAEVDSQGGAPAGSYRKGGSVSSASRRGDGIAQRGKTRGKMY